ncbi:S-layer homology domain-containing protein [uncultured Tyzzerella sp.]|uniref:S-layer homology domain-containing protein n=1 Tax=uncultured Tyzzerella sp. TaxID=2321398 RepID=UPI0029435729|nr:S-layer homology domain-containing protein [uncultured Tyzzerella sp.]
MKILNRGIAFFIGLSIFTTSVYANPLDFGIFGGITEGRKLPKTTEQLLNTNKNAKNDLKSTYKEVIFLSGEPKEYNGNITVSSKAPDLQDKGTYKVSYKVQDGETTPEGMSIARNVDYNVNYRKEGNQTIKDYEVSKWTENITAGGKTYTLDNKESKSSISIIEDKTPGVTYYKGDVSHRAVYKDGEDKVVQEISGVIYGYNSAWSSTETQRLNCTVTTKDWQMEYQVRPSVSVNKTLEYSKNEPTAISFEGNYKEVMQNKSGLSYNIYVLPQQSSAIPVSGNVSIPSFNTFEQLIAPDTSYLKGHFAEEDIKKMFAMQIVTGEPKFYKPNQAITRGQFTKMLVKAIKLPIQDNKNVTNKKAPVDIIFSDVLPEREEYPYITAAYKSGLVVGETNGRFSIDDPIQRQEAIVILLRALGLEHLGLDPTPITPFVDDQHIGNWAKREIYAANRIGIISGDTDGKFNPKLFINKAEAAAIINRLINYMRYDMEVDYTENIVNFAD